LADTVCSAGFSSGLSGRNNLVAAGVLATDGETRGGGAGRRLRSVIWESSGAVASGAAVRRSTAVAKANAPLAASKVAPAIKIGFMKPHTPFIKALSCLTCLLN